MVIKKKRSRSIPLTPTPKTPALLKGAAIAVALGSGALGSL